MRGRSSGFTLALHFLDFTLNSKGGEWPSVSPEKRAAQRRAARMPIVQANKHKRLCTVQRPLISIYFVLLNYSGVFFILAVSLLAFFQWSHLPCIGKCKQSGKQCERWLPIRNRHLVKKGSISLLPNVHTTTEMLSFFLLPLLLTNTNTSGEAFNNLTVSIIEVQAFLKWWKGVSKMHLEMQVHYWFFLDMLSVHVCSTSVWSTVSPFRQ